MTSKIIANGIIKALAIIVGIALLLFFLYEIQSVIIYLIVSLILTLITSPFVVFLKRRLKFSNTLAVVFTMFLLALAFVGLILMFVPLIVSQSENLSLLDTKTIETNATELINQFKIYLTNHHINAGKLLNDSSLTSKIDFNFIPTILNSILGTMSSFGMGLASILFITFFFLKDKIMFSKGIKRILPDNHEEQILNSFTKTNEMLSRYFIGLLIQLSIVFILYLIVLLIFGVENAFVIAFLCALLNIIPYVGPLIGSVLAAILTMISNLGGDFQHDILPTTLYVLIGFWIVQLIDNNISQPIIFSKSVNSHPLEIFLITLISGFLFGITGMIIAIPFYTMLKVIAKEFFPENKIVQLITKNI
ncbi:Predicted PurR-regulated permease PerM [Flavobacterium swingsii]|jgi:predicted PurR-regulated permease PerM|uniref:Predicted PurR-regulated permease PerM n=1 Tax=Flavobacterium swingsii TaxID=498292 RepID=A0A1I0ZTN4_9FLAO|nr:AI-2E family transporter [Flavobacterium swingsii]SFB28476.1 Predicted PurR-regulated permease PerM [Flavobacterium swingsii]